MRIQIKLHRDPMSAGATAALGIGTGLVDDFKHVFMQDYLNKQQEGMNRRNMDYQAKKQLEMWKATSYGPQVEQMKKAGINPALLYGISGGGAQTVGADMPTGTGPQANTSSSAMGIQSAMSIALMQAQKDKLEADANAANAQADTLRGKEGTVGEAQKENLWQEADNKRWEQELTKLKIALQHIQNYETQQSQADRLSEITSNAQTAMEQVKLMSADAKIKTETINAQIEKIKTEAIGAAIHNALMKSGIKLNEEQIYGIAKGIDIGYFQLDQKDQEIKLQKQFTDYNTDVDIEILKGLVHAIGTIGAATILKNPTTGRPEPIKGFGRGNKY